MAKDDLDMPGRDLRANLPTGPQKVVQMPGTTSAPELDAARDITSTMRESLDLQAEQARVAEENSNAVLAQIREANELALRSVEAHERQADALERVANYLERLAHKFSPERD